ncbi:MAG: manganese ABC transporter ATP-binding protein, partial [Verrucomicrobiota bacterium]|nr:manganese ABC transporter ATP-binding protein [Verrucomicrobiota bacterium]
GFGKTEDVFNAELLQKTYGGRLTALSEIADKLAREDI